MQVTLLPAFSDNYIFLLTDSDNSIAAVVDPGEARPVLKALEKIGAELVAIFHTHHHHDHIGGTRELMQHYPQVRNYGGAEDKGRIPEQQVFLQEGDRVEFAGRTGEVFFVPGHTRAHIAYYFSPAVGEDGGDLFCGDTIFSGGCGRLFEGSPSQMVDSLSKLRALPDNTRVWCAHEYTLKNLQFALTVDKDNADLHDRFLTVKALRSQSQPTIPSQMGIEKRTNPFLRWDTPALQLAVNSQEPVETFARLRGKKDQF